MSTPSRVLNLQGKGYANVSMALSDSVHTKQFKLDSSDSGVRFKLTTGVSGLKRRKLFVRAFGDVPDFNFSQRTIYVGDSNVTASDGFPMYPGDRQEFNVDEGAAMKAVVSGLGAGDEATVYILELE